MLQRHPGRCAADLSHLASSDRCTVGPGAGASASDMRMCREPTYGAGFSPMSDIRMSGGALDPGQARFGGSGKNIEVRRAYSG